ncbi:MAG: two-component sensor histidine kinase [Bradyrhizobium sp.]|nr:two-component sensor histidine kinase [Bradyrhizobium sp.]
MNRRRSFLRTDRWLAPVLTALLAASIFVADTTTDLEIALAVFYVGVVQLSVSFCDRRGVVLVAAGCMALTIASHLLTRSGSASSGSINGLISLSAIALTTYLVLKMRDSELAVHEARTQLAHISRITSLGELTASIAHEVKQPLTAIVTSGNASLRWLANDPPNLERGRQALNRMVEDANRASEIIDRVRNLARRSPPQKEALRIGDAILEVLALTRAETEKAGVAVRTEWADDLPLVQADRVQLQQVILNLVLNGLESMNRKGSAPRELLIEAAPSGAAEVRVAISDSGEGFDQHSLEHMFDAFYTTKQDGMGLGLTVSRSIVEAHGGRLWAKSRQHGGGVVLFTLPCEGEARR